MLLNRPIFQLLQARPVTKSELLRIIGTGQCSVCVYPAQFSWVIPCQASSQRIVVAVHLLARFPSCHPYKCLYYH